jgi:hypothetical protein
MRRAKEMPMIEFTCPSCRTYLSMPDANAGQKTACMTCGKSVSVPWPGGREPPAVEEERPARRERRDPHDDENDRPRRRYDEDDDRPRRGRIEDDYDDDRSRRGSRCPHCRSTARPIIRNEMSETGLILLICLLFVFFPIFWIGFLIRENVKYCADCGAKLGKCL